MAGVYDSGWWRENHCMSCDAFQIICNELRLHLQMQITTFWQPVSVEAIVAVMIWRLTTNIEFHTLAALFQFGRSTIVEIVLDMCEFINFAFDAKVHVHTCT